MKAIVLLSHGSRLPQSNEEMMALAARLAAAKDQPFSEVVCAFQQFAQPSFEAVMKDLASRQISQAVVVPLFLASGNHVREDLPEMIRRAARQYPDVSISVTPHLGGLAGLDRFLLDSIGRYAAAD